MAKATEAQIALIEKLIYRWKNAAAADYYNRGGLPQLTAPSTEYTIGGKFYHFTIGRSSAFLVDIATGIIYGNKGWLKVDYKKIVGNAYDPNFDETALVRDRFRYGHFENAQNGDLRQPIVRR